jgi:hypothetical protein
MVRAFLLSLLSRQYALEKEKVRERYPLAWLVWEPGNWVPASGTGDTRLAETMVPRGGPARPVGGDALCFELRCDKGKETRLRVGRAPENEIVVNDMTVSREHVALVHTFAVWKADLAPSQKAAWYDEKRLIAGNPVPLVDGGQLRIGDVLLGFHEPRSFWRRVSEANAQLGSQVFSRHV